MSLNDIWKATVWSHAWLASTNTAETNFASLQLIICFTFTLVAHLKIMFKFDEVLVY